MEFRTKRYVINAKITKRAQPKKRKLVLKKWVRDAILEVQCLGIIAFMQFVITITILSIFFEMK